MEFKPFIRKSCNVDGEISWSPFWEIIFTYAKPDGITEGEFSKSYFINKHINPNIEFDWSIKVSRACEGIDENVKGCDISAASLHPLGENEKVNDYMAQNWDDADLKGGEIYKDFDGKTPHQRDWDFINNKLSEIFEKEGIKSSSSDTDKINAIAEYANAHRGKVYPGRHPVDVALHSSFCVGGGAIMVGFCHVLGIPARTIHTAIHTMAEVFINNKWTFVDNFSLKTYNKWLEQGPGCEVRSLLIDKNFIEAIINPFSGDKDKLSIDQAKRYTINQPYTEPYISLGSIYWHFNQGGKGFIRKNNPHEAGGGKVLHPCPENIKAIYPCWENPVLISIPGRENELILNTYQGWYKTSARLDRGMGIKKEFYIDKLDESDNKITGIRCDLHLVEGIAPGFVPGRGGWTFSVNGNVVSLDKENFKLYSGMLSINIPLNLLKERSMNEIMLISEKSYKQTTNYRMPDILPFWVYPDFLNIDKSWYAPGKYDQYMPDNMPYTGISPIINTHSAWTLRPDAV